MKATDDPIVWDYAKDNGFMIVSKDADMHDLSLVYGNPQYADKSGSMEADGLPQDFQIAWREHMKAWRDYADFLNEMKNSSARKMLSEEKLDALETKHSAEITNTWQEVLRIGRNYGAEVY
jgi:predicted N-acyltransferase